MYLWYGKLALGQLPKPPIRDKIPPPPPPRTKSLPPYKIPNILGWGGGGGIWSHVLFTHFAFIAFQFFCPLYTRAAHVANLASLV